MEEVIIIGSFALHLHNKELFPTYNDIDYVTYKNNFTILRKGDISYKPNLAIANYFLKSSNDDNIDISTISYNLYQKLRAKSVMIDGYRVACISHLRAIYLSSASISKLNNTLDIDVRRFTHDIEMFHKSAQLSVRTKDQDVSTKDQDVITKDQDVSTKDPIEDYAEDIYKMNLDRTIEIFGDAPDIVAKENKTLFHDMVPRFIDHDQLHALIAKERRNGKELFDEFKASKDDAAINEKIFYNATKSKRHDLIIEEVLVLLIERFLLINKYINKDDQGAISIQDLKVDDEYLKKVFNVCFAHFVTNLCGSGTYFLRRYILLNYYDFTYDIIVGNNINIINSITNNINIDRIAKDFKYPFLMFKQCHKLEKMTQDYTNIPHEIRNHLYKNITIEYRYENNILLYNYIYGIFVILDTETLEVKQIGNLFVDNELNGKLYTIAMKEGNQISFNPPGVWKYYIHRSSVCGYQQHIRKNITVDVSFANNLNIEILKRFTLEVFLQIGQVDRDTLSDVDIETETDYTVSGSDSDSDDGRYWSSVPGYETDNFDDFDKYVDLKDYIDSDEYDDLRESDKRLKEVIKTVKDYSEIEAECVLYTVCYSNTTSTYIDLIEEIKKNNRSEALEHQALEHQALEHQALEVPSKDVYKYIAHYLAKMNILDKNYILEEDISVYNDSLINFIDLTWTTVQLEMMN